MRINTYKYTYLTKINKCACVCRVDAGARWALDEQVDLEVPAHSEALAREAAEEVHPRGRHREERPRPKAGRAAAARRAAVAIAAAAPRALKKASLEPKPYGHGVLVYPYSSKCARGYTCETPGPWGPRGKKRGEKKKEGGCTCNISKR